MSNISARCLQQQADHDGPAYVCDGRTMTWQQLWTQARQAATVLRANGYKAQQRVAFQLDDGLDWLVWFHGLCLLGCVPVLIMPEADDEYVQHIKKVGEIKHWFGTMEYLDADLEDSFYDYNDNDEWLVLTSSGTTGNPKLIVHHQRNLIDTFIGSNPFDLCREDRVVCGVRLAASFGVVLSVLGAMTRGFCSVIMIQPRDSRHLSKFLCQHHITHAMLTPRMIRFMLNHLSTLPSSIKQVWATGDALSLPLADAFCDRFGMKVFDSYGCGECRTWCIIINGPGNFRRGSLGRFNIGVEYQLRGRDQHPVATGSIGELWIRHSNLAMGYVHDDVRNQQHFCDGWYRTGDFMSQDSDGFLWYAGRRDQLIETSTGWFSCIEIENQLCNLESVNDCVVIIHANLVEAFVLGKLDHQPVLTRGVDRVSMVDRLPYTDTNKKIRRIEALRPHVIQS